MGRPFRFLFGYSSTQRISKIKGKDFVPFSYSFQQVNTLTISEDKKFLAVAGNPNIRLFDIQESTMQAALLCLTEVDMSGKKGKNYNFSQVYSF